MSERGRYQAASHAYSKEDKNLGALIAARKIQEKPYQKKKKNALAQEEGNIYIFVLLPVFFPFHD